MPTKSFNNKVSIITINYNNAEGLKHTIKSVLEQTFRDVEYIVIDGGSSDNSVEVIKSFEDNIDFWISEPDKGIYNAMNKGVSHAHGEYCLFLNSGDFLYDSDSLEALCSNELTADVVAANLQCDDSSGNTNVPPEEISFSFFFISSIPHPATLIRTTLLRDLPYREDYKIISDWIFFFEALILKNVSYQHIDVFLSKFDMNGVSRNREKKLLEQERYMSTIMPPRLYNDYQRPIVKQYISGIQLPNKYLQLCKNVIRFCQWMLRHGL